MNVVNSVKNRSRSRQRGDLYWLFDADPIAATAKQNEPLEFFSEPEHLNSEAVLQNAIWGLYTRQPEDSAFVVVTRPQMAIGAAILVFFGVALWFEPRFVAMCVLVAMAGFNLAVAFFRVFLAIYAPEIAKFDDAPSAPTDLEFWPRYSVLVPMYREAHVVPNLVRAIGGLDYPRAQLEILLVCEADDLPTVAAAERAVRADARFRIIRVPPCEPRTKPKALNYALAFARGSLLVIYDAEDRPEPDQLMKAAAVFASGPDQLACLQARLNWYNREQNWLTRACALEYALWFDYLLPGLERLGAPIPLGGTSNHFKIDALVRTGAWDPFNVTEDADLGLRLMRQGGLVGTLNSTTFEEATCTSRAWIRQRSRWIKGYMQTWLVQMRDPIALWRSAGPAGFIGFQLFVGGVALTALINPILWVLTIATLVAPWLGMSQPMPDLGIFVTVVSLVMGNAALIYANMICVLRRGWLELAPAALGTPLYWVLISVAGYKALIQLIRRPFYWEKTEHGVVSPT